MKRLILLSLMLFAAISAKAQYNDSYNPGEAYYGNGALYIDEVKITSDNVLAYFDSDLSQQYLKGRKHVIAGNVLGIIGGSFAAVGTTFYLIGALEVMTDPQYDRSNDSSFGAAITMGVGLTYIGLGAIVGGTGLIVRAVGKDMILGVGETHNGTGLVFKF